MNKQAKTKILEQIHYDCAMSTTQDQVVIKRFFKTSKGNYSEHDFFLGITVPALRKIAKKYQDIELHILEKLLQSKYNEKRLLSLLILIEQYANGDEIRQCIIFEFYIKNLNFVNNWNLVDASARLILGRHLWDKEKSLLIKLAQSQDLWKRRISIVATHFFICKEKFETTLRLAQLLLGDKHDLIHKAVGWMLREIGKRDKPKLLNFLIKHFHQMPKTTLRYATEKLTKTEKNNFLLAQKKI